MRCAGDSVTRTSASKQPLGNHVGTSDTLTLYSSRTACSESQSGAIRIRIADYLDTSPSQVEQSESLIEVYNVGEIDYYIFSNYDQLKVVWICENYECYIIGPMSLSEIKEVIDSIGKG